MHSIRQPSKSVDRPENGNAGHERDAGDDSLKSAIWYVAFMMLILTVGVFLSYLPRLQ